MQLNIVEQEEIVKITVQEERMDAHNSGDLKEQIDLTAVRFVDSSGLGALVSGFKNASARDGSLKLCCLQPQVRSMFELTRLHRVFEIFTSVEEALDSY